MAELVDALGSGPSGGNTVEVRVLFWAPNFEKVRIAGLFFFQPRKQSACALCARIRKAPLAGRAGFAERNRVLFWAPSFKGWRKRAFFIFSPKQSTCADSKVQLAASHTREAELERRPLPNHLL